MQLELEPSSNKISTASASPSAETDDSTPIEALYDENQVLLQDLLQDLELSSIREVWNVCFINTFKYHILLVLDGGVHFCTCMLLGTVGVVCRHYWKVLLESSIATFHISTVPKRWYHDHAANAKNP